MDFQGFTWHRTKKRCFVQEKVFRQRMPFFTFCPKNLGWFETPGSLIFKTAIALALRHASAESLTSTSTNMSWSWGSFVLVGLKRSQKYTQHYFVAAVECRAVLVSCSTHLPADASRCAMGALLMGKTQSTKVNIRFATPQEVRRMCPLEPLQHFLAKSVRAQRSKSTQIHVKNQRASIHIRAQGLCTNLRPEAAFIAAVAEDCPMNSSVWERPFLARSPPNEHSSRVPWNSVTESIVTFSKYPLRGGLKSFPRPKAIKSEPRYLAHRVRVTSAPAETRCFSAGRPPEEPHEGQ